jgi:isocitrate/isopropylmalate dehydrogenase
LAGRPTDLWRIDVARIAVVAGDGIGPEVVEAALTVLDAALPGEFDTTPYDLGAARYHRTGEVLPDSVLTELAGHDAILLGAVGDPSVPPGVLERGLLLKLRFEFDQYVNLRPSKLWPGVTSPVATAKAGEIDLVVVREGTEGLYVGAGGNLHTGTAAEVATGRPGRLRPRRRPTPAQGDPGAQDQRAHPCGRPVGTHVRRGGGRKPGDRHRVPAR